MVKSADTSCRLAVPPKPFSPRFNHHPNGLSNLIHNLFINMAFRSVYSLPRSSTYFLVAPPFIIMSLNEARFQILTWLSFVFHERQNKLSFCSVGQRPRRSRDPFMKKNDYCGCTTDHLMLLLLFLFSEIQFDLISLMRTDRREVNAHH